MVTVRAIIRFSGVALLSALLLIRTVAAEPPALPAEVPGIIIPDEIYFGDAVQAANVAAWTQIWDLLEPRFGRGSLRLISRVADGQLDWDAIATHYRAELERNGFREVPLKGLAAHTFHVVAFESHNGAWVFAVEMLIDRGGPGSWVPVNIITNLPGVDRRSLSEGMCIQITPEAPVDGVELPCWPLHRDTNCLGRSTNSGCI